MKTSQYNKGINRMKVGGIRMKRSLHLFFMLMLSIVVLSACGENNGEANENADYVIGATQILEHPSLDEAYEGFQAAIEDSDLDATFDYQNAQNDQNNVETISNNFVADDVDLIFANSTPSALGALNAT